MKTIFAGFAAMIVIALGAGYALDRAGFSTAEQSAGENVRLD
ncbi:hypothetical protein [Shimia biformata]|nr:hypothetical protein [Shimia biformata]